jgi:hypothetical protein
VSLPHASEPPEWCEPPKTRADVHEKWRVDRRRLRHAGIKLTPKGRPLPGTFASGWSSGWKAGGKGERRGCFTPQTPWLQLPSWATEETSSLSQAGDMV